ncbi:hypothetical protein [Parashewanella tropica]|uniref:hypothetical protein n=1 Tax=Parashewanella tropica TaxID=2547970 RepID=UPI00105A3AC3|nr:hypothetical protein [Parashewanella tropica]
MASPIEGGRLPPDTPVHMQGGGEQQHDYGATDGQGDDKQPLINWGRRPQQMSTLRRVANGTVGAVGFVGGLFVMGTVGVTAYMLVQNDVKSQNASATANFHNESEDCPPAPEVEWKKNGWTAAPSGVQALIGAGMSLQGWNMMAKAWRGR